MIGFVNGELWYRTSVWAESPVWAVLSPERTISSVCQLSLRLIYLRFWGVEARAMATEALGFAWMIAAFCSSPRPVSSCRRWCISVLCGELADCDCDDRCVDCRAA